MTEGSDEIYALLKLITDPGQHKAALDELLAQQKATEEKIAELNAMAADTRRENSAAQALTMVLDKRKTALEAREAEVERRAKAFDLASAAKQDAMNKTEQNLRLREATIKQLEASLQQREAQIRDSETRTKTAMDQAAALKEKLQRHAAAMKEALAG